MPDGQPHNIAIAEVRHDGRIARITGGAATEHDDAVRLIVGLIAQEGIPGDCVLRLDSERRPSPEENARQPQGLRRHVPEGHRYEQPPRRALAPGFRQQMKADPGMLRDGSIGRVPPIADQVHDRSLPGQHERVVLHARTASEVPQHDDRHAPARQRRIRGRHRFTRR